jgi:hypothetical protein
MICVNCHKESDGKYCPDCGQRLGVKRLSYREGLYDFSSRIYGFESTFPRTLRDVTIRPGVAAARYIEGNRAMYYGPIGYFFLMITLMLLVASLLGVEFNEVMISRSKDLELTQAAPGSGQEEVTRRLQLMVLDNYRIFSFTLIIFQTLWLKLLFRKSGYNLLEHSVMVLFVMGHMYWLTILDLIVMKAFDIDISYWFSLAVMIPYFAFACMGVYNYQSKVKAFVKGIVSFFLAYFTFAVFITIMTVIYFLADPEMIELLRKKP